MVFPLRRGLAGAAVILTVAGCGASHAQSLHQDRPGQPSTSASTSAPSPLTSAPLPPSALERSASPSRKPTPPAAAPARPIGSTITASAFGMHVLGLGNHSYPPIPFGSARIWDMGVTWRDLQPTASTTLNGSNPVIRRLDQIVDTFRAHGAQPVLTLGMTPAWAAESCPHRSFGQDWGTQTCAPRGGTGVSSTWGRYVAAIASRYQGRIRYFETWNEPSLANGYNDSTAKLARMQATAHAIVRRYGAQLVSPGVPFTNGPITNGIRWLDRFLSSPGGSSFDIVGVHLYPNDGSARSGDGPEWSVFTALPAVRALLARHGLQDRQLWNTETNVGRAPAHTGYRDTERGAAAVARTFVLATSYGIARTMWYAADDRAWGGTWLMQSNSGGVTPAGSALRNAYSLLVGTAPYGCRHSAGDATARVQCTYGSVSGRRTLLVMWSTGGLWTQTLPPGATGYITATGARFAAHAGQRLRIGSSPVFVTGKFA